MGNVDEFDAKMHPGETTDSNRENNSCLTARSSFTASVMNAAGPAASASVSQIVMRDKIGSILSAVSNSASTNASKLDRIRSLAEARAAGTSSNPRTAYPAAANV